MILAGQTEGANVVRELDPGVGRSDRRIGGGWDHPLASGNLTILFRRSAGGSAARRFCNLHGIEHQ